MTRPAVVIGLGGTGQWVLTFIKKDLLELGRGTLPSNVALLAFDTMPQATAETERQGGDKEVKVGTVKLETDKEFIHVGGNAFRLAKDTSEGKNPHIGSWFQAEHYLRALPPAAFNLSEGAGTIRQFGRLAIFHDLAQPAESQIWPNVYNAVQRVRSSVSDESALEVIIVGSFAGGTGAGMFLDMALLLRGIAETAVAGNHIVRGFFVLPRAFPVGGAKQNEMFARTFGAWRELNRFMIVDPELGLRKMVYHERNRDFQVPVEKRAYDVCYLIDAVSGKGSLATRLPEEGLFPSVADAIGAILDSKAGKKYTEHVTANLAQSFNRHPGQPMYSTIGTYSVKVPVYYVQQEFAHQMSLKMLEKVLAPVTDDSGRITGLRPNANSERPGKTGADDVYSFLETSSLGRPGETTVYNTQFLPKIAELIKAEADTNVDLQKVWAEASLLAAGKGRSPVGWLTPFSQLGDSPDALKLKNRIEQVTKQRLVIAVPPSRKVKEKPADAIQRLKTQIPKFRVDQVGVREGPKDVVSRGEFGKQLEVCEEFQVELFERMLRLWLVNTLEGQVEDALIGRTGKLGYAESFLTELVNVLDRFQTFMRKVKMTREESNLQNRVSQEVNQRYNAYVATANRPGIIGGLLKVDYDAQEAYLNAEQRAIDFRQDELLHEIVQETTQKLLETAQRTRDEIRSWAATLAVTPDSVLSRVNKSLDAVRVSHERDKSLSNVQRILADQVLDIGEKELRDALSRLHWTVDRENGQMKVRATLDLMQKGDLRSNAGESVKTLLNYASSRFPSLDEKSVAIELCKTYENDGQQLAGVLNKKSEPLTRLTGTGAEERYCYIRVYSSINDTTKNTFANFLGQIQSLNKGLAITLVDSEDPFKLTMLQSSDMIRPEDFQAWEECQEKYKELIDDEPQQAILLQAFPAEVVAAKYERKLEQLRANWRTFHPKVVMLLEDEDRLKLFFQTWALGWVCQANDGTSSRTYYELNIPGAREGAIRLTEPNKSQDIFVLMDQMLLRGADVRANLRQGIRFDWLKEALEKEQGRLGRDGYIHALREQIDRGFVVQQRTKGQDMNRVEADSGQQYIDLADLAELVIGDIIREL